MNKYTLIRKCDGSPSDGCLFAIWTQDISFDKPLADMYDSYGQEWGHEVAGDWCLGGDPAFTDQLCEYIWSTFTFEDEDAQFYIGDDGQLFDTINMSDEEINAVEKEIQRYCQENSTYYKGTYYTYWNGHNWQSILLDTEFGQIDCDYEIVDDSEADAIIADFINADFIGEKNGIAYYQGEKHKYSVSRWQSDPFAFEVED